MKSRTWIGVFMILAGAGFLLEQVGVMEFGEVFSTWWPVIFIALGIIQIVNQPNKLMGGLFMIGIGSLLIANHLTGTSFWATALPLALILFGIGFLLRDRTGESMVYVRKSFSLGRSANTADVLDDEVIDVSAVFSGSSHRVNTTRFRGGKVNCVFGGVELDLRSADMASSEASIDIDCSFGGVEVKVPQAWKVVVHGSPVFGGIENDTMLHNPQADHSRLLTIRASIIFGGLEIKN